MATAQNGRLNMTTDQVMECVAFVTLLVFLVFLYFILWFKYIIKPISSPRFIAGFFCASYAADYVLVLFHKYQYKKSRRMAAESVLCIVWYDWTWKYTGPRAAVVEIYRGFLISSAPDNHYLPLYNRIGARFYWVYWSIKIY